MFVSLCVSDMMSSQPLTSHGQFGVRKGHMLSSIPMSVIIYRLALPVILDCMHQEGIIK